MRIEKLSYSRSPWRLVMSDGVEVYISQTIDHPNLGHTLYSGPLCGDTKAECIDKSLELLETLLKRGHHRA